jgi:hypothetical protein
MGVEAGVRAASTPVPLPYERQEDAAARSSGMSPSCVSTSAWSKER